jgi:hypothetical protein
VRLNDAELVALEISENDMGVVGFLSDVDVPRTDRHELGHHVVLIVDRRGREIEVNPVLADLRVRNRLEQQAEAGGVRRLEFDANSIGLSDLPAQWVRPKPPEFVWRHGVERERDELRRHRVARGVIIEAIVPPHSAGWRQQFRTRSRKPASPVSASAAPANRTRQDPHATYVPQRVTEPAVGDAVPASIWGRSQRSYGLGYYDRPVLLEGSAVDPLVIG